MRELIVVVCLVGSLYTFVGFVMSSRDQNLASLVE
jgi:hypothetical protein